MSDDSNRFRFEVSFPINEKIINLFWKIFRLGAILILLSILAILGFEMEELVAFFREISK